MKMQKGPFAIMDMVGLGTVHAVMSHWAATTNDEQLLRSANYLKENFLNQNKLGIKSQEGYYKYPNPEYLQPDFLK